MKITAKNFMKYKSFEQEFPDAGMIRLSGDTGAGKSSIFLMITAALYGIKVPKSRIKGIGSNTEVTLKWRGWTITRTYRPDTLKVLTPDCDLEGDAAQDAIIHDLLGGVDESDFYKACYSKQDDKSGLMAISRSAKPLAEYVKKLMNPDIDVDALEEKISARKSDNRKDIIKKETELRIAISSLERAEAHLEASPVPQPPENKDIIEPNKADLSRIGDEIADVDYEIEGLCCEREAGIKRNAEINSAKELLKKAEADLAALEPVDVPNVDLSDLEGDNHNFALNVEYLGLVEQGAAAVEEFIVAFGVDRSKAPNSAAILELCGKKINKINDMKSELMDDKRDLVAEIKQCDGFMSGETLECPDCQTDLVYIGGELKSADLKAIEAKGDELATSLAEVGAKLEKCQEMIDAVEAHSKKINEIRLLMGTLLKKKAEGWTMMTSLHEVHAEIAENNKVIKEYKEAKSKKDEIDAKMTFLKASCQDLRVKAEMDMFDEQVATKKLKELEAKRKDLREELVALKESIAAWDSHQSALASHEMNLKFYKDKQKTVEDAKVSVDVAEKDLKDANDLAANLSTLSDVIQEAVSAATQETINTINEHTQRYLDMFTDGGYSAILSSYKESNKDTKAKMNIAFTIDNEDIGDFRTGSSGGEKSILSLGLLWGQNEMRGFPLMLLDEIFAGVDESTLEEATELLSEYANESDTLIICIEHKISDSFFNEVIDV